MAETLSELIVKITADATELKKALAESEKGMQGLGKGTEKETTSIVSKFKTMGAKIAIAAGVATVALGYLQKIFVGLGSELHNLSLKTGISVKALAGLKYAAEQNGASLGTVEMAIRRTAGAMQDVKDGSAEATRAFERMGLS